MYSILMAIVFIGMFILGLFLGSFLLVVVDRSVRGETFVTGRSRCEHCGHTLTPTELIPIVSWVLQKGKTRCCGKFLSWRYPLAEIFVGIGSALVVYTSLLPVISGTTIIQAILHLLVFWTLSVLFFSDLFYQVMSFPILLIGVFISVLMPLLSGFLLHHITGTFFLPNIASAIGSFLFFFLLWLFSKGKAMGDGDMYLGAIVGFLLGFPGTVVALYTAFLTGALVGVILIVARKKTLKAKVAFGPFLLFGLVIASIWTQPILSIFGF